MYINIYDYADPDYPIQIFTGGRGTGKTYSALLGIVGESDRKGILMRRTAAELELLADVRGIQAGNPFKTINIDHGYNYGLQAINDAIYGIYERVEEDDKLVSVGAPRGLAVALSTVSKVRGMDFSDITDVVYDECIPEKHVHRMRGECDAVLNAYETMNRNREFTGAPPLRFWMLSNSNDIANPIYIGLGIVALVEKMMKRGQEHLYIKERGLAIHLLRSDREFEEAKSNTAIARLTKGSQFYDMAYANKFAYNDFTGVAYRRLEGYIPICALDDAYIYGKKGSSEIYVTYASAKTDKYKSGNTADMLKFKRDIALWLRPRYVQGDMTFESYELKDIILQAIL